MDADLAQKLASAAQSDTMHAQYLPALLRAWQKEPSCFLKIVRHSCQNCQVQSSVRRAAPCLLFTISQRAMPLRHSRERPAECRIRTSTT